MPNQLPLNDPTPLDSVEEYQFEPIKGYPMLHWRGKRPFRATQYYPAQLKERHGEPTDGWINQIFWGDNLQVMAHLLKQYRGQVKLVYIDPPFDSKADYKKSISVKGKSANNDHNAFEEKQYTDIWSNDDYLQFVYERLILIRELLGPDGAMYLHCDANRAHYLKCVADEIFGAANFRNELIWQRTSARSDSTAFNHIHDTVFFYTKGDSMTWNPQFAQYSEEYVKSKYSSTDSTGRRYQLDNLTSPNPRPNMTYEWKGFPPPTNGWRYSREKMAELDSQGRIYYPDDKLKRPRLIRFLDEQKGRPIQSIWTDIYPVNSQAQERLGYPTQKPEALLERLIQASSNPGDLVFDCFMGSGTTQAVAMKLGRRFLGADINLGAIQTTTKRLLGIAQALSEVRSEKSDKKQAELALGTGEGSEERTYYTSFEVYNVNHYDVFRNPVQAKELLMEALEIQPLPQNSVYDGEKDGRMVKLMPVNRLATRQDLTDLLTNLDYARLEKQAQQDPTKPVEKLLLVCMGHEPGLAAHLQKEVPFKLDVEVVDILRDQSRLEFKRESEAALALRDGQLHIEAFYPMNLLQKLSLMKEEVEDWRQLVESVMIDFHYDGVVFEPTLVDVPPKDELVQGSYPVPADAGTVRVKITDLLSESWEGSLEA